MNKSAEKFDEKVDVYSFRIVVFFILSGGKLLKKNNKEKCENSEFPNNFTDFVVRLTNECLNFNPKVSFKNKEQALESELQKLLQKINELEKQISESNKIVSKIIEQIGRNKSYIVILDSLI